MSRQSISVVLAGGGTGGHVIPAIAVADEVVRRGGKAHFIGLSDRLEAVLVPKAGFNIDFIKARPLAGGGWGRKVLGVVSVPRAVAHSIFLLKRLKPDVVMGVGGYVAGPIVLGAKLIGIPTAVIEQNATVGITNKLLSRIIDRAFVCYDETVAGFPQGKAEISGNPVKQSILDAASQKQETEPSDGVKIVVMGGSQGALAIDQMVPAAMQSAGLGGEASVLHQCGLDRMEQVEAAYRAAGIEAEVVSFIEDTAAAYLNAGLVVARSGATTVSELTVMGLPAVFLPYPHHKDRQQERNAEPMRRAGAAIVVSETSEGTEALAEAIGDFVRNAALRIEAAKASKALGRPDAVVFVADRLCDLVEEKS